MTRFTTPKALADELGVSAKTVRAFLRKKFPRPLRLKRSRWDVTVAQAKAVRARFQRPRRRALWR
jgi:hypothetical protein